MEMDQIFKPNLLAIMFGLFSIGLVLFLFILVFSLIAHKLPLRVLIDFWEQTWEPVLLSSLMKICAASVLFSIPSYFIYRGKVNSNSLEARDTFGRKVRVSWASIIRSKTFNYFLGLPLIVLTSTECKRRIWVTRNIRNSEYYKNALSNKTT